jgi:tetratricopeptide (TPR) repeat protein
MLSAIIPIVNRLPPVSILIRVLIPLLIILPLGISSNWRAVDQALHDAHKAMQINDNFEASIAIVIAAQYVPWRNDLWEQAGILALDSGQHGKALELLLKVDQTGSLSPIGKMSLGDAAQLNDDHQTAVKYWQEALQSDGPEIELHKRLAETFRQLGDLENAIPHLTSLVKLNPIDAGLNYNLGLMFAASQPESALAYLTLAAELDPNQYSEAQSLVRDIRSALLVDDQAYLLVTSGQTLASIEEWELAVHALTRATQLNPEYAEAWAYLGEALQHIALDGFPKLEQAISIDPDSIAANTLMGLYWQRKESYDLALTYFHAAANQDEQNPALQAEIGNTLGMMGNLSAAETHYRRAIEFAPRDPTYWRMLANFYITFETKLQEEGLPAARQAVILDPTDPTALDVLAQIYLLMDSPLIARRFLHRAISANPNFAPAHLHMGLIHLMEGNTILAHQKLTLAQNLAPEGSLTKDQARRLLESHFP